MPIGYNTANAIICEHKRYPSVVFQDAAITDICIECGMDGPCLILVDIGDTNILFKAHTILI
jgi:hypothetical protein